MNKIAFIVDINKIPEKNTKDNCHFPFPGKEKKHTGK
jgi:hypothetical protein